MASGAARRRRRQALARYTVTADLRTTPPVCALCGTEIDTTLKCPDPGALTIGHEPPVSVATSGVIRDECYGCNTRKDQRMDHEV